MCERLLARHNQTMWKSEPNMKTLNFRCTITGLTVLTLLLLTAAIRRTNRAGSTNRPRLGTRATRPIKPTSEPRPSTRYDLSKALCGQIAAGGDLTTSILQPLAQFILNKKFVENPMYRGTRLNQMINIFNAAFVKEWVRGATSPSPAFDADQARIPGHGFRRLYRRDLHLDCVNAATCSPATVDTPKS